MPYPNEHAAQQFSPNLFRRYRRMSVPGTEGLSFILGWKTRGKSKVQSVRAKRSFWTVPRFRTWLRKHGFKSSIESATGREPRLNPVTPPVTDLLSERDLLELNRLETEWQTYENLAERALERGDHFAFDRYLEKAQSAYDWLESVVEDIVASGEPGWLTFTGPRATSVRGEKGDEESDPSGYYIDEPSLYARMARGYSLWLQAREYLSTTGKRGYWEGYTEGTKAELVERLRWEARGYKGFLEENVTDEQLVEAAEDAFYHERLLRERLR